MQAIVMVNRNEDAVDFVQRFLDLEHSRFFTITIITPNHSGPIGIQLQNSIEVHDTDGVWSQQLIRSFNEGMLSDWKDKVSFIN